MDQLYKFLASEVSPHERSKKKTYFTSFPLAGNQEFFLKVHIYTDFFNLSQLGLKKIPNFFYLPPNTEFSSPEAYAEAVKTLPSQGALNQQVLASFIQKHSGVQFNYELREKTTARIRFIIIATIVATIALGIGAYIYFGGDVLTLLPPKVIGAMGMVINERLSLI